MKFSLSWLKRHLETEKTAVELADAMVSLGLEVEEIIDEAETFNNVVVGHIITRTPHPDADKLGVCQVNVGEDEPRTIVCGAPNARDNLTVAVAIEGAVLPGDFKIKPTKIRGVKSNGMICSVRELGLGTEHEGIWELETDAEIGTPLAQAIGADDVVFDVSMTPNRGDALSVYGIARDLAAGGHGTFNNEAIEYADDDEGFEDDADEAPLAGETSIKLEHEGCPFFTGQLIKGVKNGDSPAWMAKFLEQAGLRPINALADITNFMLQSYGQPMHAYDADKLQGDIRVAPAKGGEKLQGLDGNEHTLAEGDIAIMDDSGVIGIAGIVGGESTSVDETTTNVYLEVAQFNKHSIAVTGQRLQCNTDARYRFERGIDPSMTVLAAINACDLIIDTCGGESEGIATEGTEFPQQRIIAFSPSKVRTFGGLDISADDVQDALEALNFDVEVTGEDAFNVTVPHHFTIMDTPEDLVEEVLRLKGYDNIPTVLPEVPEVKITGADLGRKADRIARRTLASLGYLECINYSFIGANNAELFAEGETLLTLDNPLDEENMNTMRPSLIPSLLEAATKNLARNENLIRLGEVGKVYTENSETLKAAALLTGKATRHWQGAEGEADVFTAKADAMEMLSSLGLPAEKLQVYNQAPSTYHPGRSGSLALGKNVFATFGEVHPKIAKAFGLKGRVAVFEIDLIKVEQMNMKAGNFFNSAYQSVNRDFALLVNADVKASDLIQAFKGADKDLVRDVTLFDVYEGENVEAGKKSVGLSITLQAADRTLTDTDINAVSNKVIASVKKRFDAEVR